MNEAAIQRELDAQGRRLDQHGSAIDSLMEFRAEVRGSLRTLSIIAGLGLAIPGAAVAIMVLRTLP
jgi:hypothetical protein